MVDFFFDVDVGGGNVGFGLVVIVVADEIFDGVLREEAFELVIELRGERFVVRQDQRGAIGALDDLGHGEGLAGAGDAEQDLMLFAGFEAADELVDGCGLIAAGLIVAGSLKFIVGVSCEFGGRCRNFNYSASGKGGSGRGDFTAAMEEGR